MKVMNQQQLDARIDSFLTRKTEQFPELSSITASSDRPGLRARAQNLSAIWPHITHPRHSH